MGEAQGFWSYVHKDDKATHGAITRLADHVCEEYALLTGGELNLFRDLAKIEWGDRWKERIRSALEATTFFIPIVTPRYFASVECKKELLSFARQAEEIGLQALIMPIYFVDVPALNEEAPEEEAMRLIADSQREDWRNLRLLDETTQPYRVAVNKLCERLVDLAHDREGIQVPADAHGDGDDEDSDSDSEPALRPVSPTLPLPSAESSEFSDGGEEGEGILDLLVRGEETFPQIVEVLNAISEEIGAFGELATAATAEVQESDAKGGGFKGRLAVANRLANKMNEPADRLEALSSQYAAHLITVDPAVKHLIAIAVEQASQNKDETDEFFAAIRGLTEHSQSAAAQIEALVDTLDESSRYSRELAAPLTRVRSALQSLIDGHAMIESWSRQIDQSATLGS